MSQKKIIFFTLFFLLSTMSFFLLFYLKSEKIDSYLTMKTKQYTNNYTTIYSHYSRLSHIIFDTRINTQEVKNIFKIATQGTQKEKDSAREELYLHLFDTYKLLKTYKIKQLHFHLPNNDSYLRFHRPQRYGDNLGKIRESVVYVNKNKKYIDGFEEGRIYNGYRFVFPLFDKEKYLGSVEISFSTLAMTLTYMQNYDLLSNFIISKDVVHRKVFPSEHHNYTESPIDGYYLEVDILKHIKKLNQSNLQRPLSQKLIDSIHQQRGEKSSFSLFDNVKEEVITFIQVKNPVTQEAVGIFIVRSDATYILDAYNYFYISFFIIILLIALTLYYLYKADLYKKRIEKNNRQLLLAKEQTQYLNRTLEDEVALQVEKIKESELVHQTIFNTVKNGMAIVDLELNFILVNDAYEVLTGFKKEELYSKSCLDQTIQSMVPMTKEVLALVLKNGFYKNFHKSCMTREQEIIEVIIDLVLMPNKEQILVAVKDVTLENRLKREKIIQEHHLLQQSRFAQMGEMISMIAHQWRQPLSSISAAASNLKIRLELNRFNLETESGRKNMKLYFNERIDNINNYVQGLSTTIDDFRNFYKPNKHSVKVTLAHVVDKALTILEASLDNSDIEIIYEYNEKVKFELYDNEMMQVILNILKNAQDNFIERKTQEKKIRIITEKNSIMICDNGGGIDKDIIEKVFDPYFSTKDEKNGTGIGLYMSKIIVEEHHHGTLTVHNTDNGVCFTITL